MSINPDVMQQIKAELLSAPYGHKTETLTRWAIILQRPVPSLYRELELNARVRKGEPKRPELRDWAKVVAAMKKTPPPEAGELSTDQAVRHCIEQKKLPVVAMDVPAATYDRIMRELGTSNKAIRASRFQAKKPNQAHHFDASTSKFLYVAKKIENDYILKLHRPAKHYKNKPIPVDALRPWYYGLVDDHSGRLLAMCTAAQGESAHDSLLALSRFWTEIGLPDKLLADQGMLKKALHSSDLIERLGVELPQMMPYAHRGHGKIERPWRTLWQRFEKQFFACADWSRFEILLSELNRQLGNYLEEYNGMPHRFERQISRMDAWRRVMLSGGIVKFPENALATVARRKTGTVDEDGTLEYCGQIYSVKGIHAAKVYIYEGVFEDKLVVENIITRERFEVKKFVALDEGEYRAYKDTPHQAAAKAAKDLNLAEGASLFKGERKADAGNVVSLPIRSTEREVPSVFDVEHYASIEDAWAEIHETVGVRMWSDLERRQVEQIITEGKLAKDVVKSLAMEMREVIEIQKAKAI